MIKKELGTPEDLAYLRAEALQPVLFCLMVALYLWYLILFHPMNPLNSSGWGPALVAIGIAIAFIIRNRNVSFASAALILGIAGAIIQSMWLAGGPAAPYLLAIVVSLTGLLFNLEAVIWVTLLCSGTVVAVGSLQEGHSLLSPQLLSPVLVIVAVGILSSLTVHNLYLTLYWAWDRAMAARLNEEKLLDRQGELARTLKALDLAYQQLEHLNYDLARARAAADEARLAKQQFATNVSHELRTPLNVILAFSEMMYLSPGSYGHVSLPPAYRGDIREIYRSSKYLLKLTEDVLNLSKIEAREMKIHPQPSRLQDVVTEAIGIVRPLLRGKAVELRAQLPDNLPLVMIDRGRISQVLLNLLNNARRFTEQGMITVQANLETEWIRVMVTDTGSGIPPEELPRIFRAFQQLDHTTGHPKEGSGLGLVISKRFVEMHGGHLWAESEGIPGRGSRFHFTLPLNGSQHFEALSPESRLLVRTPSGRGRVVLLLDQDPYIAQLLEEGLEDCQVIRVSDLLELPALLVESQPRAVILNETGLNGSRQEMLTLFETLDTASTPLILCPLVGPQQQARALSVTDYLVKPVTREALMALFDRLPQDIRRILVIDDDPQMGHLLARLLQANRHEVQILRANNGQKGLETLQEALPDLILMDLSMPEMDGYSLLSHMRADPRLSSIPVAIITAHTSSPEEERHLGSKTLLISHPSGFTNEEVLTYLRSVLEIPHIPVSLQRARHPVQHRQ